MAREKGKTWFMDALWNAAKKNHNKKNATWKKLRWKNLKKKLLRTSAT